MPINTSTLQFSTRGNADILDITTSVGQAIAQSGLMNGVACLFCPSSTTALTTIEYEPGCLSDLQRLFDEIVPANRDYAHNARWHDGNGHSHLRAALLGASLSVPFSAGTLLLGTWQQIIYVDFDNRPRRRELVVQLVGE
jgi:secondary thiamine-phosphate synthase enzyme